MHQVRCVRNYVLVVKTVLKQTEEDGKGHTQSASTRRTNLLLGGRPAGLACFLATDGRRRTGGTHAGQAKGGGQEKMRLQWRWWDAAFPSRHTRTHTSKKEKKKGGMLLLWDLLLCENGREDTMASKQRGRPTELRVSVLCANYAVML